jgi:ribosomal protein S18 acetylase RimI-like enzyme
VNSRFKNVTKEFSLPPDHIRNMTLEDLKEVVRIHQFAFRGFFLDLMGPAFLNHYYASVLSYPKSVAIVSETEQKSIIGFSVGFLDPAGFYAHFRSRRLTMMPTIIWALIRRPYLISKVVRNTTRVHAEQNVDDQSAELSSIATTERGAGVGSELARSFCARAFKTGATEVQLSTDEIDNDGIRAFYERLGFKRFGHEQRGKRRLCLYRLPKP